MEWKYSISVSNTLAVGRFLEKKMSELELDTGIDINIYISMDTGRNVGLNK